jgi:hypothetical protein
MRLVGKGRVDVGRCHGRVDAVKCEGGKKPPESKPAELICQAHRCG